MSVSSAVSSAKTAPSEPAPRTPPTPPTPPTPRAASPFINRNFALLWIGETVSTLGNFVFDTALVVWIAAVLARGQAWAPLAISGVLVAASLSPILVAPFAGVFVDRWNKRATLLTMDVLRAVVVLLLLPATGIVRLPFLPDGRLSLAWTLGAIYGSVCIVSVCNQFFGPAILAQLGDLVEEPLRPRAMGFLQGSQSLAMLIGPAVAPPLLLAFGAQWALLLNAASFGVSFLTLALLRIPRADAAEIAAHEAAPRRFSADLREGVAFLLRSRALRTLMFASAVAMLGGGILNALDVFFTTQNLHTPIRLYGLLNTALGLGLIVGAILAGALAQRIGLGRVLWLSLLALGIMVIIYARLDTFVAAAIVLFFAGAPLAALGVAAGPLVLRETPAKLVGRVESLMAPAVTLASLGGAAAAGYLDSVILQHFSATIFGIEFGPVDTIYGAAGVLIFLSGLYALRGLRGADRPANRHHEAA